MGGSVEGGRKAAATNKRLYGDNHYAIIGSAGGKLGKTGGFAYWEVNGMSDKISAAGKKGGTISRRPKSMYYKLDADGEIDDSL